MTVQQLRIYEVDPARRDAFLRRFEEHAARIMRERYGFSIIAMWESTTGDKLEFVYLLQWPDRETLERQWAAFMADPEWERAKQEARAQAGGEPVLSVSGRVLEEVPFSPRILDGIPSENLGGSN